MRCDGCRWYAPKAECGDEAGDCRISQPEMFPVEGMTGQHVVTMWPRVAADDYCGEYEAERK